jgi:hypothetical protein
MIVVLLYYKNGTNDGTPESHEINGTGNERRHKNQPGKNGHNKTKIGPEIKTIQEEMKAQVGFLTSRIDANQEEMKEEIKSCQAEMEATVSTILKR